ncbi:MAG: TraR/DksA C4-type zinc finger protein [Candidatus Binatia bacterium]
MKKEQVDSFARLLRQQRDHFLEESRRAEQGLEAIAEERESELEEHAQEEQSARLLTRLDDRMLHAVKEVDLALQKILDATYGKCEVCHKPIALARLRSLPAARCCKRCAAKNETPSLTAGSAAETPIKVGAIPADLSLLSDQELTEAIKQHLKEDGRIDVEELHVAGRKGVVYLSGLLPSEAEHQILLKTLTDVMGLQEIVDHLEIAGLLWQTEKRTREAGPEISGRWQDPPGSEDIVESMEEDKDFVAPAKPTANEE